MEDITILIQVYNEENIIVDCIKSANLLSNNIVVVDTQSTDNTVAIATKLKAKVYVQPLSQYVEPVREYGIKQVKTKWVLILDADEEITQKLAEEIKRNIEVDKFSHFSIPRKNIFARKKWLCHGGWWPDSIIRLIKIESFVSWPRKIHSTPQIKGKKGQLKNPILHYFHSDLESMASKTAIYEDIEAELLYRVGTKVTIFTLFRKFAGELNRRLIRKHGYADGIYGWIESIYQAYSKTITWLFIYEKNKKNSIH